MTIKGKCVNINQHPSGRALIQFAIEGKDKNKPDAIVNLQLEDGKKAKQFDHLETYDITFKKTK